MKLEINVHQALLIRDAVCEESHRLRTKENAGKFYTREYTEEEFLNHADISEGRKARYLALRDIMDKVNELLSERG